MWHVIYVYNYISNDTKQASYFKEINAHKTLKVRSTRFERFHRIAWERMVINHGGEGKQD